ncbi:dTDP-glucose 4,6-dehydratase/UDP-glucose 4-epimerase [Flavobacteriaceae bacterium MAR_2010_188]|nr:dTDP-glucose 4,6-dehydratase/UDP-glucose 4-epimerase [Flavobacteriaceae bacterium MAR_2010_188]
MKKLLIIGSKGFIGSHCTRFFKKKYQVWECDVVTDYVEDNYFIIDASSSDYNEIFEQYDFDLCINCSGAASVPDSIKHPQRDFNLNVVNVAKQLEAIRKFRPNCKYINLSSAAVYGNPNYLPIDESHPLSPISPYGVHKKMSEELCSEYYNNFGIKTVSLRIFSAYGNGLYKQLFYDLYKKTQTYDKISLFGTGRESRDFIHVSDIVKAIEIVMLNSNFQNEVYNIGSGVETSIDNAASLFIKHLDLNKSLQFGGEIRIGDPLNWVADMSKLQDLGFYPSTILDDGLLNYARWLKESE